MKNPNLKDKKDILKPLKTKKGTLSKEDKEYITTNWKEKSTAEIALVLKRSETQVDEYIKANLYQYEEENAKSFASRHHLERHKNVMQMTEVEASKVTKKKDKKDRPWIFKQP